MADYTVSASSVEWVYYDLDPQEMWGAGHVCYDWCVKVTKQLEINTKATAPGGIPGVSFSRHGHEATGRLASRITAKGHRTGPESYGVRLNSPVYYSAWVHGGTAGNGEGYIYSTAGYIVRKGIDRLLARGMQPRDRLQDRRGRFMSLQGTGVFMILPPGPGGTKPYHLRVSGQRANAFLTRGWNITNAQHGGSLGAFEEHIGFFHPDMIM